MVSKEILQKANKANKKYMSEAVLDKLIRDKKEAIFVCNNQKETEIVATVLEYDRYNILLRNEEGEILLPKHSILYVKL